MLRLFLASLITSVLAIGLAAEPANLYPVKQSLIAYIDSGLYQTELAAVADEAKAWIEQRAAAKKADERLAMVFDVDETMLNNLPEIRRNDFGYIRSSWVMWVNSSKGPAIAPSLELYRTARKLGIAIIILTGRFESERAATEINFANVGYEDYLAFKLLADGATGTTASFKAAQRAQYVAEGYTIIANIGDQKSDFEGGYSERDFKLPNPFYLIK